MLKSAVVVLVIIVVGMGIYIYTNSVDRQAGKGGNQNPVAENQVLPGGHSVAYGDDKPPVGEPSDYLPMKTGMSWTYKVELGSEEPTSCEEVIWPSGRGGLQYLTRSRFKGVFKEKGQKEFILQMRVKGPAEKQGGLEYPLGAEVEILKDDLGVFEEHKQVFFAAATSGRFMAHLVVTHPPDRAPNSGGWGSWGGEDGYSMRLFCFGAPPDTQISMGMDKAVDHLLFDGVEPFGKYKDTLHFTRTVDPNQERVKDVGKEEDPKGMSILDSGFTEDTWFARGVGLAHLVQKRGGAVAMTWTLTDFSPGTN